MVDTLNTRTDDRSDRARRASPVGAYIATAGAIVLLISVWLDWLTLGPGDSERNPSSGYEGDGVIPLMGYLAIGFAVALLVATVRADRRQHRGLSLASFAAGLACLLWSLSFLIDPISTVQFNENVSVEVGPWIALIGALLWSAGSLMLAMGPDGDYEPAQVSYARPATSYTEGHMDADALGSSGRDGYGQGAPRAGWDTATSE